MVENVLHIKTISELMHMAGFDDIRNPLIEVIDLSRMSEPEKMNGQWISYGFYSVNLKTKLCADILYGRSRYDYDNGTLLFIAPNQPVQVNNVAEPEGMVLMFHPELIRGTAVEKAMQDYRFFGYNVNEALHISEREKTFFYERVKDIEHELAQNFDKHSRRLIVDNVGLLLDYCVRFYDRQFLMREPLNTNIAQQFEQSLSEYVASGQLATEGIPCVRYFAEKMGMTPNYFGDSIKTATGRPPQSIIQERLIGLAKDRLTSTTLSIKEIAYSLGYEYPQYFVRLFRQQTGQTPTQYRSTN